MHGKEGLRRNHARKPIIWLVPLCNPTRQYSGSDYSDTSNSLNKQAREIPVPFTIIQACMYNPFVLHCSLILHSVRIDSHRIYYMYIKILRLERYLYSCASIVHWPFSVFSNLQQMESSDHHAEPVLEKRFKRRIIMEV